MGIGSGGAIEPKSMRWCSYSFMLTSRSSAYQSFQNAPPTAITTLEAPARDWGFRNRGRQGAVTGGARC